jgi:hypothetical protein
MRGYHHLRQLSEAESMARCGSVDGCLPADSQVKREGCTAEAREATGEGRVSVGGIIECKRRLRSTV